MADNTVRKNKDIGAHPEGASLVGEVVSPRRRNALGRGLSALMSPTAVSVLPETEQAGSTLFSVPSERVPDRLHSSSAWEDSEQSSISGQTDQPLEGGMVYLSLDRVVPNQSQPRKNFPPEDIDSLANSIKATGLLQPIIVRKKDGELGPLASYEIVAGERRWRAAKQAQLSKIPALVKQLSDRETLEFSIVENVQRADLNPIEEAQAYQRLLDEFALNQQQVATTVGKDRTSVANALRLLKLPDGVQQLLVQGRISPGHGRALLMLDSTELQLALAKEILVQRLSVRELEQLARSKGAEQRSSSAKGKSVGQSSKSPAVLELEERFRRSLGTKVNLSLNKGGKGELRISFFSQSELERLLDKLGA